MFIGAIGALAVMTVLSAGIGFALPNLLPRLYTHYAAIVLVRGRGITTFPPVNPVSRVVVYSVLWLFVFHPACCPRLPAVCVFRLQAVEGCVRNAGRVSGCVRFPSIFACIGLYCMPVPSCGTLCRCSTPSEELQEVEEELVNKKREEYVSPRMTAHTYPVHHAMNCVALLLRSEDDAAEKGEDASAKSTVAKLLKSSAAMAVMTEAFTLTFLAEWGDRSQIATIALAAAKDPIGGSCCCVWAAACARFPSRLSFPAFSLCSDIGRYPGSCALHGPGCDWRSPASVQAVGEDCGHLRRRPVLRVCHALPRHRT